MATYKLINSATVGSGGAANIQFTNIPATYTDLVLFTSLKTSYSGAQWGQVYLKFNGSSASFSNKYFSGNGSSPGTGSDANTTGGFATTGGTGGTNAFANNFIYILNYTSSNHKIFSTNSLPEMNTTTSLNFLGGNLWSNTAVISSISIEDYNSTFVQYSTAYLYGISNA
jgi:hypothetical protein